MPTSPPARRHPPRQLRTLLAAALCALLASACADGGTAPVPDGPSAALRARGGGAAHLVSNRIRYRDSGGSNATGRSGTATLTASALRGADGTTWLIVTTGSLEALAAAAGEIAKLQVKLSAPDGASLGTHNLKAPGGAGGTGSPGSARLAFPGLAVGTTFRLQANVRGIDGRRTDVVTVTGRVVAAPVLEVRISAPEEVVPDAPTLITATVTEVGGGAGTRTDCVLYVDGVEVDRARDIWVDAGDAVTCAFTHTFARTGDYQVEVRVDGGLSGTSTLVGSRDADTVSVLQPAVASAQAWAEERTVESVTRHWYGWLNPVTGSTRDYSELNVASERSQTVSVQATLSRPAAFPVARVRLQYGSGATGWDNDEWSALTELVDAEGRRCANRQVSPTGALFFLCSGATGTTSFGYSRFGGVVTYHSEGFSRNFDGVGVHDVYTWNDTYTEFETGEQVRPWGADVWVRITVTDAAGTFGVEPVIPLAPFERALQPYQEQCETVSPWWLDGGSVTTCSASEVREFGRSGQGG